MENKTNMRIRIAKKMKGVYQYELAEALGISEYTLTRKLRKELDEEEEAKILKEIDNISKKKSEEFLRMITAEGIQ